MEEKITYVEGTDKYVRKGNSVYKVFKETDTPKKVICECLWCGERFGANSAGQCAIYCKRCKTAEGRQKIKEENDKIKSNVSKIR